MRLSREALNICSPTQLRVWKSGSRNGRAISPWNCDIKLAWLAKPWLQSPCLVSTTRTGVDIGILILDPYTVDQGAASRIPSSGSTTSLKIYQEIPPIASPVLDYSPYILRIAISYFDLKSNDGISPALA